MVNENFLFVPKWENFAGATWSTRPFCRPAAAAETIYHIEIMRLSLLARSSL
jgi:hypothetical protein